MTDFEDSTNRFQNNTLIMQEIEAAIVNKQIERLKVLLTNEVFDEIQKSYLIKLAKEHKHIEIEELLKATPATL